MKYPVFCANITVGRVIYPWTFTGIMTFCWMVVTFRDTLLLRDGIPTSRTSHTMHHSEKAGRWFHTSFSRVLSITLNFLYVILSLRPVARETLIYRTRTYSVVCESSLFCDAKNQASLVSGILWKCGLMETWNSTSISWRTEIKIILFHKNKEVTTDVNTTVFCCVNVVSCYRVPWLCPYVMHSSVW